MQTFQLCSLADLISHRRIRERATPWTTTQKNDKQHDDDIDDADAENVSVLALSLFVAFVLQARQSRC